MLNHLEKYLTTKSWSFPFKKGLNPIEFAKERKKMHALTLLQGFKDENRENLPAFVRPISRSKVIK